MFGRKGRLYWLVSLQLCPAIWALIIGLVSLFLHKVSNGLQIATPDVASCDCCGVRQHLPNHDAWEDVYAWSAFLMFIFASSG